MPHPAKLRFCGAAGGVTGSCYHLEANGTRVVIDCGVFQGRDGDDATTRAPFPFEPRAVDAVILTHGHLDHVGRLPLLARAGFRGPVYGHPATLAVARLVMEDTAHVGLHAGSSPLYTEHDVAELMARAHPVPYQHPTVIGGLTVTWYDAGHILGSSSVRVAWREAGGAERAALFSGDLGNVGTPIIRDPFSRWDAGRDRVDFVVTESTYGDRAHPDRGAARKAFRDAIKRAVSDGGKVLVPAFAIGRTQELLYELSSMVEAGELPGVPVVVDGPMGLDATAVYERFRECYDNEAMARVGRGHSPLEFNTLFAARAGRASAQVHQIEGPAVIIAGSGMCSGGRILGHLREYLPDPRTDVLFVGYQAAGSLGRRLQEGAHSVQIEGAEVRVRATVTTVTGLSAHADREGLAAWFSHVPRSASGRVFVTHGEDDSSRAYASHLSARFGASTVVPQRGDEVVLA